VTSPTHPDPAETNATAQGLTAALNGLAERLDTVRDDSEARDADLKKYGRVNRHRIWLSYALVALDVILTVVVALLAVQARNASATANETRAASVAACQSTNVARAENEQLWDYVLTLFAPRPGETAAEAARGEQALASLRAHVTQTFEPRNCEQLYAEGSGDGAP
jgi:hypothetical protein